MNFTLHAPDGYETFGGLAHYHFDDNGLLHVSTAEGTERVYSPGGWTYVETDYRDPTARVS